MDFKHFKKVGLSKSGKTTVFKHKDGHFLHVAHGALISEHRKAMESLPCADGGDVESDEQDQSEIQPTDTIAQGGYKSKAPVKLADGTDEGPLEANNSQPAEQEATPEAQAESTQDEGDVPNPEGSNQPTDQSGTSPQATPVESQDINQEGQAWLNDLSNGHITPETYSDLFAKKDTLGKIGTLFGMLVGGAGSGLAHQPNALLGMMNNEIQNDLQAQEKSKEGARNFLQLGYQHELQQAQAQHLTAEAKLKQQSLANIRANWSAFHKMSQFVQSQPPGSSQRAKAENALGLMFNATNNENFGIADRANAAAALFNTGNPAAAQAETGYQGQQRALRQAGRADIADANDQRHFPGLSGQSSVPLSGSDREYLGNGISFQRQLDNFRQWASTHSGDLSPKDKKEGQALAADLQGAYRQATHGGVYKEGEANFISKLIDSNPTKFFNSIRVLPSLKAISDDNRTRIDQYAKNVGFSGYTPKQQGQVKEQYKVVNGVKYKRGPNGEAIRVE
jgi:hypothetical protein